MSWGSTTDRQLHESILCGMDEIRVQETSPDGRQHVRLFRTYSREDEYGSLVVWSALDQVEAYQEHVEAQGGSLEVLD